MKKFLLLPVLILISVAALAQIINDNANWPNAAWTVNGIYTPAGLIDDPTITANYHFDDDEAGGGSADVLSVESPVIDISAAVLGGETNLVLDYSYAFNFLGSDVLTIDYWDADAAAWVVWEALVENSTITVAWCGDIAAATSPLLDISGFTATQQSGFRYRIFYNDGGGWNWGHCFTAPVLTSTQACTSPAATAIAVDDCGNSQFFIDVDVTSLGDGASVTISNDGGAAAVPGAGLGITQIGPFAEGSTVSVTIEHENVTACNIVLPSITYICPPSNDLCTDALAVSCGGTYTGNTSAASTTGQPGDCVALNGGPGVWYVFTGNGDDVTASLCNSTFDTKIQAWEGACGALTCLTGVDDSCGLQSEITFGTTIGVDYYIYVFGFNAAAVGAYELNITCTPFVPPPANDDCINATALNCGDSLTGESTFGATGGSGTSCIGTIGDNVWYTITGTGDVFDITVNTDGTLEAQIDIYETTDGTCATIACSGFSEAGLGLNPVTASFISVPGTVYYINVGSWIDGDPDGDFDISVSCMPVPPPPVNDLCGGAIDVACGDMISGDTTWATETDEEATACGTTQGAAGVWYHFVGDGNDITASLCGSSYDTKIQVWEGACGALTCVDGNDDSCGTQSEVTWTSVAGTDYYIYVYGFGTATGTFDLSISCCTNPPTFTVADGGNNCPLDEFFIDVNVTALGDVAAVDISDGTTTFFTGVGIGTYNIGPFTTGQVVDVLLVGSASPGCFATDQFTITACPPANDLCGGALEIFCGQTLSGSTIGATEIDEETAFCGTAEAAPGVWYHFVGNGNPVTASLCGSAYDTKIQVWEGACGGLTCVDGNDDFCGLQSEVTWTSVVGTDYYIYVFGFGANVGAYDLFVDCAYSIAPGTAACTPAASTVDISAANGNDNIFVPFFDSNGDIICEVNANGNQLGVTSASLYVDPNPTRLWVTMMYAPRNIDITPTVQPTTPVDVRMYMPQAEYLAWEAADPNLTAYTNVTALSENNGCDPVLNGPFSGVLTQSGASDMYGGVPDYYFDFQVTSFSNFFFTGPNILSAELDGFTGDVLDQSNVLSWRTNSEDGLDYFDIQRSKDGFTWELVGTEDAIGISNTVLDYQFKDEIPPQKAYYKLGLHSKDGTFQESNIIVLERVVTGVDISIHPNPAQYWLNINHGSIDDIEELRIIDLNGKVVSTSNFSRNRLWVGDLAQGLYVLQIVRSNSVESIKFVKQ